MFDSTSPDSVVVVANGQRFEAWETIEVTRNYLPLIVFALMSVAEPGAGTPASWANLKLQVGDPAQVFLNGVLVVDGLVYLRQTAVDSDQHAVQIGIASKSGAVIPSTVDANPGSYKNQTLQQIGSSVFGKVGVTFKIVGNPPGADKPFARVNEIVGESRFAMIERLGRMRNIHLLDDGKGTITGSRGPQEEVIATIVEGNYLRARLILDISQMTYDSTTVGQNFGNNSASQNTDVSANGKVPGPPSIQNRSEKGVAEHPGDAQDMQMRNNHQIDWNALESVDGSITIPGWALDDGSLWIQHIAGKVSVISPLLVPAQSMVFMIKGVSHRRNDNEGTVSELFLAREDSKGIAPGVYSVGNNPGASVGNPNP